MRACYSAGHGTMETAMTLIDLLPATPEPDAPSTTPSPDGPSGRGPGAVPAPGRSAHRGRLGGERLSLSTPPPGPARGLVAMGAHFNRGSADGRRTFYTPAPIKALVSEKFFDLCHAFGPAEVRHDDRGMPASTRRAPIICCTRRGCWPTSRCGDGADADHRPSGDGRVSTSTADPGNAAGPGRSPCLELPAGTVRADVRGRSATWSQVSRRI